MFQQAYTKFDSKKVCFMKNKTNLNQSDENKQCFLTKYPSSQHTLFDLRRVVVVNLKEI